MAVYYIDNTVVHSGFIQSYCLQQSPERERESLRIAWGGEAPSPQVRAHALSL
jgi:hypothetical protein